MSETTSIAWVRGADGHQGASWNPWRGCHPCRRKCAICYREAAYFRRTGEDPNRVIRASRRTFTLPLRLRPGTPVFVCSLSDFFIEEADPWRSEAWDVMWDAWELGVGPFIIPTSRPDRIVQFLHDPADSLTESDFAFWDSVWFLASIADHQDADELLPHLLRVPVGHLGVSHEPATGTVKWGKALMPCSCYATTPGFPSIPHPDCSGKRRIEWLICGGANHTHDFAWHMPIEAAQQDRDQAAVAGIPFFFKGHGEWCHEGQRVAVDADPKIRATVLDQFGCAYQFIGRKAAGALLDGVRWEQLPWASHVAAVVTLASERRAE